MGLNLVKGFSIEYIYQPTIKTNDIKFDNLSAAVKYQLNQHFELPLTTAAKLSYVSSQFNWNQTISNTSTDVDFDQKTYVLELQVSKKFNYLEPYAHLGYITSTGSLSTNGASLFNPTYSTSSSSDEKTNGTTYGAGVTAALELVNFAFEINSTYTNLSTVFKTSAQF